MPGIGSVTALAKQRNILPFPSQPYAGSPTPGATGQQQPYLSSPITPTQTPTTVGQALSNTTQTVDQAKAALGSTQPFLDNYLKPNAAGTTPFRQALTNTKATDTANAYDAATTNIRNKSAAMGFSDSSQPVTFGAEAGLANNRAKAIADIPNQVNLAAQPVEFQAAQMQQQQPGILNQLAQTQQSQAGILEQQKAAADAQKAALTSGLAQTGIAVGGEIFKALNAGKTAATVAPATIPAATTAAVPAALAGTGSAAAADASIAAGGAPLAISGVGLGAAGSAGAADASIAAGEAPLAITSGGGLMGAVGALASNPITWVAAAAIVGAILWRKSQVHPTADTFVQGYQNPFGQHLGKVVDGFDQALASGQMTKDQAQSLRDQTAQLIQQFQADTNAFSQKGGHEAIVAKQAAEEMAKDFGPNWENILGKMDSEIAGLA